MSPPFCICSRKAEVPDLAMVPRFSTSSAFVMPTPRSRMESTLRSLSTLMRISRLAASPVPSTDSSVRERNRILSRESDPLLMSSRRKMSLLLYSELMMMSIRRETSAWNSCCSAPGLKALSLCDMTVLWRRHERSGSGSAGQRRFGARSDSSTRVRRPLRNVSTTFARAAVARGRSARVRRGRDVAMGTYSGASSSARTPVIESEDREAEGSRVVSVTRGRRGRSGDRESLARGFGKSRHRDASVRAARATRRWAHAPGAAAPSTRRSPSASAVVVFESFIAPRSSFVARVALAHRAIEK